MKRLICVLMTVAVAAMLLNGCGAKKGGELNLYTWDGMFPQEVLTGFEEETGIRINYSNFDYDEDMLAKLEETQGEIMIWSLQMTISSNWPFRKGWFRNWTYHRFRTSLISILFIRVSFMMSKTSIRCRTEPVFR